MCCLWFSSKDLSKQAGGSASSSFVVVLLKRLLCLLFRWRWVKCRCVWDSNNQWWTTVFKGILKINVQQQKYFYHVGRERECQTGVLCMEQCKIYTHRHKIKSGKVLPCSTFTSNTTMAVSLSISGFLYPGKMQVHTDSGNITVR